MKKGKKTGGNVRLEKRGRGEKRKGEGKIMNIKKEAEECRKSVEKGNRRKGKGGERGKSISRNWKKRRIYVIAQ